MRYILLVVAVLLFESVAQAQPDTILAENIYRYTVRDGKRTPIKHITEQKTYELNGKLIRRIFFKDSTMAIKQYIAFIYDDDNLISEETFGGNDSILKIKRYRYTTDNLLSDIDVYKRLNGQIQLAKQIKYYYDDSQLTQKEVLNKKNKWQVKTKYTYNQNEKIENSDFKKGYRKDKLKSKSKLSRFIDGKITDASIKKTYFNKEIKEIKIKYEYDPVTDNVLREIRTYSNDTIPEIIEYRYKPDGTKTGECVVDEDGKYLEFTGFERKKHDVIRTEVKMYDLSKVIKKKR